jgi:hypothetical protein
VRRGLVVGVLLSGLALSSFARAASPEAPTAARSISRTETASVNPPLEKIPPRFALRLSEPSLRSLALQPELGSERRILGLRLPTFIAFGLGGLSAGGALATRFAATRGNDPNSCDSRCTDHDVRQRALLITTGVLTGMAAAGVGIGITLMLKAPKNPKHAAIRPRFDLGLSGEKAVAKVGWVFRSF